MKNGLLIWNVVLTLLTGYLLVTHFSAKGGKPGSGKSTATDTAVSGNQFRIAYFEMDSVANNFEMVKQVKNELSKKESENTAEIERMAKELQQRYNYYQKKATDGTITEDESKNAGVELKKMDDDIKMRKQQLDQDYFDYKTRRENEVKKNIETFIKKYNEGKNYTYIMSYEPGLFYYRDTALNITADVVKGLNVEFAPVKKK
jgi:outer membrane protein